MPIEYDGIIARQSIFVPVQMGTNIIQIGVADTGDRVLDSGLFILGIEGSSVTSGGTFQEVETTPGQTYDAGTNNYVFTGTPQTLNNTVFTNFSDLDQIFVNGYFFSDLAALFNIGSLEISLDTDDDGSFETTITLEDPVINATINITPGPTGSTISLKPLKASTDNNDHIKGSAKSDYLGGGTRQRQAVWPGRQRCHRGWRG